MKITVSQSTSIVRYDGTYPSIPAFFMSPSPVEADRERVSAQGEGQGEINADGISLCYTETSGGTRVTVSLSYKDGELTVMRGGSEMRFLRGATTRFSYSVGYGYLPMTVYTQELTRQDKGGSHLLHLAYLSVTDGMVSRTEIRFKLDEKA